MQQHRWKHLSSLCVPEDGCRHQPTAPAYHRAYLAVLAKVHPCSPKGFAACISLVSSTPLNSTSFASIFTETGTFAPSYIQQQQLLKPALCCTKHTAHPTSPPELHCTYLTPPAAPPTHNPQPAGGSPQLAAALAAVLQGPPPCMGRDGVGRGRCARAHNRGVQMVHAHLSDLRQTCDTV